MIQTLDYIYVFYLVMMVIEQMDLIDRKEDF